MSSAYEFENNIFIKSIISLRTNITDGSQATFISGPNWKVKFSSLTLSTGCSKKRNFPQIPNTYLPQIATTQKKKEKWVREIESDRESGRQFHQGYLEWEPALSFGVSQSTWARHNPIDIGQKCVFSPILNPKP